MSRIPAQSPFNFQETFPGFVTSPPDPVQVEQSRKKAQRDAEIRDLTLRKQRIEAAKQRELETRRILQQRRQREEFVDLASKKVEIDQELAERGTDSLSSKRLLREKAGIEFDLANFGSDVSEPQVGRRLAMQEAQLETDLATFNINFQDDEESRRRIRLAGRDVDAAARAFRTGEIDEKAMAGTLQQLQRAHGQNTLLRLPQYRVLTGAQGQYEQKKQQAIKARAQKLGVKEEWLRFDDRTGEVVFDQTAVTADQIKKEAANAAIKPLLNVVQQKAAAIERETKTQREALREQLDAMLAKGSGVHPQSAVRLFQQQMQAEDRRVERELAKVAKVEKAIAQWAATGDPPQELFSGEQPESEPSAPVEPTPEPPQQQAPPPRAQIAPNGAAIKGSFENKEQLEAAKLPPGSYFRFQGHLMRFNEATGEPELAN